MVNSSAADADAGSPVFEEPQVRVVGAAHPAELVGRLVVSADALLLLGDTSRPLWTMPLSKVVLHAVSTDLDAYPRPCVYCQVERDGAAGDPPAGDPDADAESELEELRLVPECDGEQAVQRIFDAMAQAESADPFPRAASSDPANSAIFATRSDRSEADEARAEAMDRLAKLIVGDSDPSDAQGVQSPRAPPPPGAHAGQFDDVTEDEAETA